MKRAVFCKSAQLYGVVLVGTVGAFDASCVGSGAEPCTSAAFTIEVPKHRAADVASVTQSGLGCDGNLAPYCEASGLPCFTYGTRSTGAGQRGACTVTVTFKSGAPPFVATTTFAMQQGCTTGGMPTPDTAYVPATIPTFDASDAKTADPGDR